MFIMKVISQLARMPTPCLPTEYVMKNLLNSEAPAIRFATKLKIIQGSTAATSTRCYSDKPFISRVKDTSDEGKKQKISEKKKRDYIPKITLLDQNNNITVTTMQEASKLAQRRNLKLIYLRDDPKSDRSEYKLVSSADYLKSKLKTEELEGGSEEKLKSKTNKKEKLAQISSKIAEHDLHSKIKQIRKWVDKRCEVRIAISNESGDSSAAENVFKVFEKEFKTNGRITQKVARPDAVKFIILPPKTTNESTKGEKESKKQKGTVDSSIESLKEKKEEKETKRSKKQKEESS